MLGTCLRRLVVLLSLVAVAAFAGHGSAMAASAPVGMTDHHHSGQVSSAQSHADGRLGHAGLDPAKADGSGAMACCGKSCTSLLPFPLPPEVAVRSRASDLDAVEPDERTGIRPPELKRPPKLA